jgi:hypothetical protein
VKACRVFKLDLDRVVVSYKTDGRWRICVTTDCRDELQGLKNLLASTPTN